MQSPVGLLSVMTIPPGATTQQARLVLDGVRGAIFVYAAGNPAVSLVGSWAGAPGTDPYGNVYPEGLSGDLGVLAGTTFLVYSAAPANGNLIGSWSSAGGTDVFGNVYPAGLFANQGQISGVQINSAQILSSVINQAVLNNPAITNPAISGGAVVEASLTFDSTGGKLLVYASTTTVITQTVAGDYMFTAVTPNAKIECWGAGAGAGGGNASRGGETGGGGEYAAEPNYPLVVGNVYNYTVGSGGQGGITGQSGNSGSGTFFDGGGVFANPGIAGGNFLAGQGGSGSVNTVHFNGGDGANAGTTTGGSSGGNSGGPTANGNNGIQATTSTGAAAPTAQGADWGTGAAGGNNGANGNTGGSPGAAGGACGSGSAANTLNKTYYATSSRSYFGSDASSGAPPNGTRITNGTMYQGGETAGGGSFNGVQKSACLFNSAQIQADFAGATMTGGYFAIDNQHSWYNSGMSVKVSEWQSSQGTSLPSSWDGNGAFLIGTFSVAENKTLKINVSTGLATAFQTGTARGIALGPGPGSISNPNLNYYGYFYGTPNNPGVSPTLNLTGTTGTGSNQSGSGSDGKVRITYTSSNILIAAISPAAGTDGSNNAFAAGFTGQIQAIQPGSSPTLVETWHTFPAFNVNFSHGSPVPAYKLNADNTVSLAGIVNVTSGTTSGTVVTIPTAAYIPISTKKWAVPISAGAPAGAANVQVTINNTGAIILSAGPTGAAYNFALDTIRYPLDY